MNRMQIANTLNEFFMNVGKLLHDDIIPLPGIFDDSNEPTNQNTMRLFYTTSDEIFYKIIQMKNSKTLKDYISSHSCKSHALQLAPILSTLINECFSSGTFPDLLKCARIIPLYKDGNQLLASNYRPISWLITN